VIGGLALARLGTVDWLMMASQAPLVSMGAIEILPRSLLLLFGIVCLLVGSIRCEDPVRDPYSIISQFLVVLFALGWIGLCLEITSGLYQTIGWVAGSIGLLAFMRLGMRAVYGTVGGLLLAGAMCKWLLKDVLEARFEPKWDPFALEVLINAPFGVACSMVVVGLWALHVYSHSLSPVLPIRVLTTGDDEPHGRWSIAPIWHWGICGLFSFLLVAISFEVDRLIGRRTAGSNGELATAVWSGTMLREFWFMVLWAAGGVGMGLIGRACAWRIVMQWGVALVFICAFGWLTLGTFVHRISEGAAAVPVVLNLQFACGGGYQDGRHAQQRLED
jgi:hypothetical protein